MARKLFEAKDRPEKIQELLNDLLLVGENKPVGYLPVDTLVNICGVPIEEMKKELESKGLRVMVFSYAESGVGSGALYAYDHNALSTLLSSRNDILERNKWPTEPELFVMHLKIFAEDPLLFNLVADAFSDNNNPGRSDIPTRSNHAVNT